MFGFLVISQQRWFWHELLKRRKINSQTSFKWILATTRLWTGDVHCLCSQSYDLIFLEWLRRAHRRWRTNLSKCHDSVNRLVSNQLNQFQSPFGPSMRRDRWMTIENIKWHNVKKKWYIYSKSLTVRCHYLIEKYYSTRRVCRSGRCSPGEEQTPVLQLHAGTIHKCEPTLNSFISDYELPRKTDGKPQLPSCCQYNSLESKLWNNAGFRSIIDLKSQTDRHRKLSFFASSAIVCGLVNDCCNYHMFCLWCLVIVNVNERTALCSREDTSDFTES